LEEVFGKYSQKSEKIKFLNKLWLKQKSIRLAGCEIQNKYFADVREF